MKAVVPNYENKVAEIVRRARFIQEETGQQFYFREFFDEPSGDKAFSVFGVGDEAATSIKNNNVGLPSKVEDFIKVVDGVSLGGNQGKFVDNLFDLGKPADELIDSVDRGISQKISQQFDEINSFDTARLNTSEGREALATIQRQAIETIAYGISRTDPKLGDKLTRGLEQSFTELSVLPEGSNGLLNEIGNWWVTGDDIPTTAIRNIWKERVPDSVNFIESAKATESDQALAEITRAMDETSTIALTRQGNAKIVIEAVRFIDPMQAQAIRKVIAGENITDVSFSFDSVIGVRTKGVDSKLYRGKTGKAFDDVLTDSTGVCST